MANKTKSIKGANDKEIDELITRLRKENEVQNLIADLKRKSDTNTFTPYDRPEVSTEEPIENLYHYGKMGMRWGRRKGASSIASKSKISRKPTDDDDSEDYKKKIDLKKKKLSTMTNAELKEFTQRMNLEKQYKELTKTAMSPGKKFVSEVLGNSAKQIATKYVTEYGTKAVASLLKKASGD